MKIKPNNLCGRPTCENQLKSSMAVLPKNLNNFKIVHAGQYYRRATIVNLEAKQFTYERWNHTEVCKLVLPADNELIDIADRMPNDY